VVALDTPPPAGLDERELVDALTASWALDADEITYDSSEASLRLPMAWPRPPLTMAGDRD